MLIWQILSAIDILNFYVDDDEDYGYDPEFEDDDADSSVDEDDNEPV